MQLGIIKEFIDNFHTFQQRLNKPDEHEKVPIDGIINGIKDEEDKAEFLQYKITRTQQR